MTIVANSSEYQEMVAGDDLILACEVSCVSALVQWYCNDKLLSSDSRTCIESYGTLRKMIISDIQPSDSGQYVCDAVDDKMVCVVRIQGKNFRAIFATRYQRYHLKFGYFFHKRASSYVCEQGGRHCPDGL